MRPGVPAAEWEGRLNAAAQTGDAAFVKRVEAQALDAGYGAYMKERGLFLSAIHSFASELYLLSSGIPFGELPNPELFPDGPPSGVRRSGGARAEGGGRTVVHAPVQCQ